MGGSISMSMDASAHPGAGRAFDTYVVNEVAELLLMRRAFSHRPDPGVWTSSLHGHREPHQGPVETAQHLALTTLGMRLLDVTVVVPSARLQAPGCPDEEPEPGSILLARTSRRVLTPDPTCYDDASWVSWDTGVHLPVAGHGLGAVLVPDEVRLAVAALTRTL